MTRQTKAKTQRKASTAPITRKRTPRVDTRSPFETTYPAIVEWVEFRGWIEIGRDDYRRSMIRALDEGGMVWEGKTHYASMDELLRDLENGLIVWREGNG